MACGADAGAASRRPRHLVPQVLEGAEGRSAAAEQSQLLCRLCNIGGMRPCTAKGADENQGNGGSCYGGCAVDRDAIGVQLLRQINRP